MSRSIHHDQRDDERSEPSGQSRGTASQGRGGGGGTSSDEQPLEPFNADRNVDRRHDPTRTQQRPETRSRATVHVRSRAYQLSPAELKTMAEIGRFRTIAVEDLARFRYAGNNGQLQQDLTSLQAQKLVQRRTVSGGKGSGTLAVVVLTRAGKRVLKNQQGDRPGQAVYAGFVKPNEVGHDAAIYRMYQAEAARIEAEGGVVERVVLDYELKQKVYSPLAKARELPAMAYAERQAEIAKENGLQVVEGKIPLPDLRIEYQTRDGSMAKVDLELATEHYRGSHVRAKAAAGFQFYAANATSSGHLSAVFDDHDIVAEILSL